MTRLAVVLALVLTSTIASATTLPVGPGKTYATPCAAIAAAHADDIVEIAPGTYTDSCAVTAAGLTVRGVGGRPKIDLSGTDHPAQYKGIYVIAADRVTIENLELTGAHISTANGSNGAGLRIQASDAAVRRCYIHDNQNGILAAPLTSGAGTLTIENSEFDHNGLGDGCSAGGCTHNLYIGDFAKLVFRENWTHNIAHDLDAKGHLLKSRAYVSQILFNRITGEGGHESYGIDLPNGGLALVVGNLIEKGADPDNFSLLAYGLEGLSRTDHRLFVVNNTFVNDASKGTFINVATGGVLTAHNNLFIGPGTLSSTGALSEDNLRGDSSFVVDLAGFDYHLREGAAAIDRAVDPGTVDGEPMVPIAQYVHPASAQPRMQSGAAMDIGPYEFAVAQAPDAGTEPTDAGLEPTDAAVAETDAGATPTTDAGNPVADAGSTPHAATAPVDASDHADVQPAAIDGSGCGCSAAAANASPAALVVLLVLARGARRHRPSA